MNFPKQVLLPLSLTAALFLAACGDKEESEPTKQVEETTETTASSEEETIKESHVSDQIEPILLMSKQEMIQVQFPLDRETITDYLFKGGFVPEGYKLMTDSVDGNNFVFRIFEDFNTHITTWDVLHVNAETGKVSSENKGFDHVNVGTINNENQSAIYKEMLAKYNETDEAAEAILSKETSGEQYELNELATGAKNTWEQFYADLLTVTLENVDQATQDELNAKANNWQKDFEAYQAKREKEADGIYLYGAGLTFEFLMYQLEFAKLSCDELLEILVQQTA